MAIYSTKTQYRWPFSIAMLNYQMVPTIDGDFPKCYCFHIPILDRPVQAQAAASPLLWMRFPQAFFGQSMMWGAATAEWLSSMNWMDHSHIFGLILLDCDPELENIGTYLVGGDWNMNVIFPSSLNFDSPNWRTLIFFRGVGMPPTRNKIFLVSGGRWINHWGQAKRI